jgi:hypothetical protein
MKEGTARSKPALHEVKIVEQMLKPSQELHVHRQKQGLWAPVHIFVGQVGSLQVLDKLVKTKSLLGSDTYAAQYPFDGVQFRRARHHEFINVRRH